MIVHVCLRLRCLQDLHESLWLRDRGSCFWTMNLINYFSIIFEDIFHFETSFSLFTLQRGVTYVDEYIHVAVAKSVILYNNIRSLM